MIRRLRVRGYKSLARSRVELAPLSVILGPNSAGKSNYLDLIHLLSRLASRETVREAFDGHRGLPLEAFHAPAGFGPSRYEKALAGGPLSFRVECDLEVHPRVVREVNESLEQREHVVGSAVTYTRVTETRLRYAVEIAMEPRSGELYVLDESLTPLRKDLEPKAGSSRRSFFERETVPERPQEVRESGPAASGRSSGTHRFVARIERQAHPRYFETHRPRTLLSELSDPVYHPHVVAAAREISSWRVYYVEPTRMRGKVGIQGAREPGRSGELLAPYYYYLQEKHPSTLKSIVRNLSQLVSGLEQLRVDAREGYLELVAVQSGGAEFPARLLSEGTLRLLCILGIAVSPAPPSVVVYEEPENGVNPARIDLIADVLRNAVHVRPDGPQFIVTTHSPLVCDALSDHLILCTSGPDGTSFERFSCPSDSLFFQRELVEGLDGRTREAALRPRATRK